MGGGGGGGAQCTVVLPTGLHAPVINEHFFRSMVGQVHEWHDLENEFSFAALGNSSKKIYILQVLS